MVPLWIILTPQPNVKRASEVSNFLAVSCSTTVYVIYGKEQGFCFAAASTATPIVGNYLQLDLSCSAPTPHGHLLKVVAVPLPHPVALDNFLASVTVPVPTRKTFELLSTLATDQGFRLTLKPCHIYHNRLRGICQGHCIPGRGRGAWIAGNPPRALASAMCCRICAVRISIGLCIHGRPG